MSEKDAAYFCIKIFIYLLVNNMIPCYYKDNEKATATWEEMKMSNLAYDIYNNNNNAVIYDFTTRKKVSDKLVTKDNGTYDNRAGKKCEVYAFRTDEEIKAMIDVYDKHIKEAADGTPKMIACRNKMLFIIGINIGVRASDLRLLTWDFFFDKGIDGNLRFRKSYSLRPKKTQKTGKYVNLYFNDTVKKIINWYIEQYPIENINDYVFKSRKGNGPITVRAMWDVIKSVAKEAGIEQNIGSHSMRKSWSRRLYDNAKDKSQALVLLQTILNHSSASVTLKYIGILNDEIEEAFDGVNLGFDFI